MKPLAEPDILAFVYNDKIVPKSKAAYQELNSGTGGRFWGEYLDEDWHAVYRSPDGGAGTATLDEDERIIHLIKKVMAKTIPGAALVAKPFHDVKPSGMFVVRDKCNP